jgi:hypothetical protein
MILPPLITTALIVRHYGHKNFLVARFPNDVQGRSCGAQESVVVVVFSLSKEKVFTSVDRDLRFSVPRFRSHRQ